MITKMVSQIDNGKRETEKDRRDNTMNIIKWDDKLFNGSGTYIWVYSKGLLVSTNNRKSRSFLQSKAAAESTTTDLRPQDSVSEIKHTAG